MHGAEEPLRQAVAGSARGLVRALALVLVAAAPAWGGGPLRVVATTTDLQALVREVGGDRVSVESLAPPLVDPHAVDVKPGHVAALRGADLLVRIGLGHEPWLPRALRTADNRRLAPGSPHDLDASRGIALLQAETPRVRPERGAHVHGLGNPHYWLDPDNARPITAAIAGALTALAPADRGRFEDNRSRFLARLEAGLARWTAALRAHRGTRVVVVHDTWPYFARRFGLVVVAAVEPSPGVPPSPASLAELTRRMRESGVRLVLAEPSSNAAVVDQVAARGNARAAVLVPSVGGDPAARDFIALFDVNVERLAAALAPR